MTLRGEVGWHAMGTSAAIVVASLALTTIAVYVVQEGAGVADASMLYLLAVALVAYLRGSWAAVATAIGAFLTYNFLFLPPRFTFQVADPQHILTLLLLLAVGAGIGRLTGLQRDQAERSERREHEARALFGVSRAITSAKRMQDALPVLVTGLAADARMARVWIGIGSTWAHEQVVASSDPTAEAPASGPHNILRQGTPLMAYIDATDRADPAHPTTVVLPEFVASHFWEYPLHNQTALRLKVRLFFRRNTVVIDVPYHLG